MEYWTKTFDKAASVCLSIEGLLGARKIENELHGDSGSDAWRVMKAKQDEPKLL